MGGFRAIVLGFIVVAASAQATTRWEEARALYDGAAMPPGYTANSVWAGRCVNSTDHEQRIGGAIYFRSDSDPALGEYPVLHWAANAAADFLSMPFADVSRWFIENYFEQVSTTSTPLYIEEGLRAWQNTTTRRWAEVVTVPMTQWRQDRYGVWYQHRYNDYRTEWRSQTRTQRVRYAVRDGRPLWLLGRFNEQGEATSYCYFNEEKTTPQQRLVPPENAQGVNWFLRAQEHFNGTGLTAPTNAAALQNAIWAGKCVEPTNSTVRYGGAVYFHREQDPVLASRTQAIVAHSQDFLNMPFGDLLRVMRNRVSDLYSAVGEVGNEWRATYTTGGRLVYTWRYREKTVNGRRVIFLQETTEANPPATTGSRVSAYCYYYSDRTAGAGR